MPLRAGADIGGAFTDIVVRLADAAPPQSTRPVGARDAIFTAAMHGSAASVAAAVGLGNGRGRFPVTPGHDGTEHAPRAFRDDSFAGLEGERPVLLAMRPTRRGHEIPPGSGE